MSLWYEVFAVKQHSLSVTKSTGWTFKKTLGRWLRREKQQINFSGKKVNIRTYTMWCEDCRMCAFVGPELTCESVLNWEEIKHAANPDRENCARVSVHVSLWVQPHPQSTSEDEVISEFTVSHIWDFRTTRNCGSALKNMTSWWQIPSCLSSPWVGKWQLSLHPAIRCGRDRRQSDW